MSRFVHGVSRAVTICLLALVALLATSCSRGPDNSDVEVTFGSTTIALPTALHCSSTTDNSSMICSGGENDDDAPHVSLAPGTPLTVSVPQEVGDTPWVVVFAYVDDDGQPQSDRTAVFPPKDRYSYHLTPPANSQLTRLEVQSLFATPGADGGVEFPAVQTWVLVVDPVS